MTRFTRDIALRLMPHSHMTPNMLTRIMAMVMQTITADHSSKPSNTVLTTKMDASDTLRLRAVSYAMNRQQVDCGFTQSNSDLLVADERGGVDLLDERVVSAADPPTHGVLPLSTAVVETVLYHECHCCTYYDRAHPLFEDELGKDFLEESEEVAVRLCLLSLRQLRTAKDVELTSCLLASRPSKLTKQLICNRKSIKTAKPANMEKVLTAGMLDRAPAEEESQQFNQHSVFKVYFTQEKGHCLREGGEEHAGGYVSKDTTDLLVEFLMRHPLIPLEEDTELSTIRIPEIPREILEST
ncbi:hypothetical protein F7725_011326 [Dissostichus mawsoni]|uniref:Uncharacterized protein n=1 Tax=Dissostichus mawsoni TaxID=36200 RepID=A0A7J5Z8P6_DISMA|nr:hypothetical protein F7725_011326 [Dissostichus mawsoni]